MPVLDMVAFIEENYMKYLEVTYPKLLDNNDTVTNRVYWLTAIFGDQGLDLLNEQIHRCPYVRQAYLH